MNHHTNPDSSGDTEKQSSVIDYHELAEQIKQWASELGFEQTGITDTRLDEPERHFLNWLDDGFHGEMDYMERHGTKRSRPQELTPGTIRVISTRLNYQPAHATDADTVLSSPNIGYVSRYALGRDYHKLMRKRLQTLAQRVEKKIGPFGYRAFVDSAPVLEKALARKAGLGWVGKHSNILDRQGSWFFLGEIYTDLPLPIDAATDIEHCGSCTACITACPTGAIVAPYQVDARLCISYLTIEFRGSIPEPLRHKMGNRIYGCDDCQLVCPWNRFSAKTQEADFEPRHTLDNTSLVALFSWSEQDFDQRLRGSAIRRIGYECWLRNIAVALGNAATTPEILVALQHRQNDARPLVREHVQWALRQHEG